MGENQTFVRKAAFEMPKSLIFNNKKRLIFFSVVF